MRCCCWDMWTCLLILEACHLEWRLLFLVENTYFILKALFYLYSCRSQCLLLLAPGFAAGIWLWKVFTRIARSSAYSASVIVSAWYHLLFVSFNVKSFSFISSSFLVTLCALPSCHAVMSKQGYDSTSGHSGTTGV